jgi:hypothetical protein
MQPVKNLWHFSLQRSIITIFLKNSIDNAPDVSVFIFYLKTGCVTPRGWDNNPIKESGITLKCFTLMESSFFRSDFTLLLQELIT